MRASRARARGPLPGGGALQSRQQRGGEDVEGQGGGHRVPGRPEHGCRVHGAEHDRVPRAHGDAVHREGARSVHDGGGVVVAAGARAGHHDHEVAAGRGAEQRGDDLVGVVAHDRQRDRLAADLARLGGEHERVRVGDLALGEGLPERTDLVARRQDGHDGPAVHHELREAGGARGGDVHGPQPVALGQEQLGRADVLADRAHVLVGRRGLAQLGVGALVVHVLAHDHGVEVLGHGVAGVHGREVAGRHQERRRGARAHGRGRPHRDPVHGRGVVGRGGETRPHRPRPSRGRSRRRVRARSCGTRAGHPAAAHASSHACQRLRGRPVADERISHRASPRPRCPRPGRSRARRRRRSRRRR